MTLKQLLKNNNWLSIATELYQIFPEEEQNNAGYEEVIEKLMLMAPENSEMSILVIHEKDGFEGEDYVDVCGKYENPKNEEQKLSQALEFTPWKEWLGMEIHPESLTHFSEQEILAHCLHEMTFMGFKEEQIQKHIKDMKAEIEAYKNLTEEEKNERTISLDEFFGKDEEDNHNKSDL